MRTKWCDLSSCVIISNTLEGSIFDPNGLYMFRVLSPFPNDEAFELVSDMGIF